MLRSLRSHRKNEAAADSLSDARLIEVFVAENNTDYFGLLFERYTHLVFGVCMKYLKNTDDAEDAVMSIFEKLMTDLKKHEVKDFKNWLYRVAKNHCLMQLRKRKVWMRAEDEITYEKQQEFMESAFPGHLNDESIIDTGILISLQSALKVLKEEQKKCLEMMYLQNKSYIEIAQLTGYSMKQVKSYIQNGKRNLKNIMVSK